MSEQSNKKILLVDDNQAIHQDFRKILSTSDSKPASTDGAVAEARAAFFGDPAEDAKSPNVHDFELESAYQGEEAYEMITKSVEDESPYAMAFVDVRMPPGWDGVQTIKKIWEVDPNLQVVICTAFADYSWDDMIEELGESDRLLILKKPFDPVEVCQFATALTEKWRVTTEARAHLQKAQEAEQEARSYAASLEMLNRALEAAKATAEAAAAAKSEFLANMSHEIRTPMVAILGYTDLLREGTTTDEERTEYLGTVHTNGKHLLSILDDILDITRIESGNLPIESRACSPHDVLSEVHDMVKIRAAEKGLPIELELSNDLPAEIQSDPTRLRQVLLNLVSNAIKFTEHGHVKISTSVERPNEMPDGRLRFDIADTGIGISKDDLTTLFETFTQGDTSSTREFGGTGLGLAISKRLAQMLHGDIKVDSKPGHGSTFTFAIPIVPSSSSSSTESTSPSSKQARPQRDPASPLQGRILLVEDFAPTQRLIATLLTRSGADVDQADNGQAAVDLAVQSMDDGRAYDLIVMDMQMPVLDGYRATERLRTLGFEGPIVALTAHAMSGDREKCLKAGCNDYAPKPIDRRRLLTICRSLLEEFGPAAPLPGTATHEREESRNE